MEQQWNGNSVEEYAALVLRGAAHDRRWVAEGVAACHAGQHLDRNERVAGCARNLREPFGRHAAASNASRRREDLRGRAVFRFACEGGVRGCGSRSWIRLRSPLRSPPYGRSDRRGLRPCGEHVPIPDPYRHGTALAARRLECEALGSIDGRLIEALATAFDHDDVRNASGFIDGKLQKNCDFTVARQL